ncbi:MAG: phage DNA encapsidation protein [Bacteroidales bacterium]|nr:phage DNA encapsidation protein [Bacteroidales bacterium]
MSDSKKKKTGSKTGRLKQITNKIVETLQKKQENNPHYSSERIRKLRAVFNIVIGKRSNGKTFDWKTDLLRGYAKDRRYRGVYIRRKDTEVLPKNIAPLFELPTVDAITGEPVPQISDIFEGEFNSYEYKNRAFTLVLRDEETGEVVKRDSQPFCFTCALATWENRKGVDVGEVRSICFDEFMTREPYLRDEFVKFMNVLSSFIRDRDTATIWMLANTVNKYCPYFEEMGLTQVDTMEPGSIQLYRMGAEGQTTIAVEMCASDEGSKKVEKYFAFDNPQLEMITSGSWEIALYPHCPCEMTKEDIVHRFYILFNNKVIAGDIMQDDDYLFILYHYHKPDREFTKDDILYLPANDGYMKHCKHISDTPTEVHKLIYHLIKTEREFYASNEVGEVVRNWKLNVA